MPLGLDMALRNARLQAVVDKLDAGAGAGVIEVYDGIQPATGGALASNVLLGTLTLSDPSSIIATGVLTFGAIADDSAADANGTITWARFKDSDGNFVMDSDCGVVGSGATIIFNAVTVTTGGVIRITSGTLVEGNP